MVFLFLPLYCPALPVYRLATAIGGKATQHLSAAIVGLLSLSGGMSLGWTSAASDVQRGAQGFPLTAEEWSWVGAMLNLGAVVGCLAIGALIAPYGRQRVCLGLAPVLTAGWALHAWAFNVWMLLLGRTLVGFVFGATCVLLPIYTSEVAETAVRGALGSYLELMLCIGVLLVYLMGGYLPVLWLNLACLAVPVVFSVCFASLPDTPRWLLSKGYRTEARKALAFYRGARLDGPPDSADQRRVDAELCEAETAMKARVDEVSLAAAFGTRAARKGLALAVGAMLLQQLSGIDAITFYASQIFEDAGTMSLNADEASMVMAAAQIVSNLAALLIVDRIGRRPLFMASAGAMAVCCFLMGTYFYLNNGPSRDLTLDWVPMLVSCVYMVSFAFGLGPVVWLFVGEIFPDQVKGPASAIATTSNWLCAFFVTKFFPTLNEAVGGEYASFWAFGSSCVVAVLCFAFLFPETKGRSLDEIQDDLSGGPSGRLMQNLATTVSTDQRQYGSFDSKV